MDFVLASGSPARKTLLEMLDYRFIVVPSNIEEYSSSDPAQTVVANATNKALAVSYKRKYSVPIVGCDTIVYYKGKIIGKPSSTADAVRILSKLQGKTHEVYGGICVIKGEFVQTRYSKALVRVHPLKHGEILSIARQPETKKRAGGYAIQEGMARVLRGRKDIVIGIDVSLLEKLLSS